MHLPEVFHRALAVHVAEARPSYPLLQRTAQDTPSVYDVLQLVVLTLVKLSVPQVTAETTDVAAGPSTALLPWRWTAGPPNLCTSPTPGALPAATLVHEAEGGFHSV